MNWTPVFAPLLSVALIVSAHGQKNDKGGWQDQTRASASQEDPLVGVWRFETTFAPSLDAELSVSHAGKSWSARFAGADVAFDPVDNRVEFAFREGLGRFRGVVADDERAITGFWIRPGVTADPRYPGGSSQSFAAPVTLTQARPNEWHGRVQTLEDSLTLFLRIHRDEAGKLVGAFRDQGQNSVGGAMQFQVTPRRNDVDFTTRHNHRPDPRSRRR